MHSDVQGRESRHVHNNERQRRLDRELHLGNRQRRAARPLRPRLSRAERNQRFAPAPVATGEHPPVGASAVPKRRVNGRGEDVIFFDGVFFKSSLKSIFFVS